MGSGSWKVESGTLVIAAAANSTGASSSAVRYGTVYYFGFYNMNLMARRRS